MHTFSSRSPKPNINFERVQLDAEEYDGRFRKCVFQKDYSCHLFFSFILAKKKRTDDTFEGASWKKKQIPYHHKNKIK
jgi:hypothetical protein